MGAAMTDVYATARDMIADLKAKKVSARELLNAHVVRNDKIAKTINAVIDSDLPRAQKDAAAVDDARSKGAALGPLAGLPMTIKDCFDVEGWPALCGNPEFKTRAKNCADAALVSSVRKAGAVIWGKTNVPFMVADIQTYNAVNGTTNNPYDVTRGPGGSSGGAAAALASGVTPLEIGTDIGGSLRHPANYCGVTSLKPTWGALSQRGYAVPLPDEFVEHDLNVVGPMARNSSDLKLLWHVLRNTQEQPRRDVKGARVAVWDQEDAWPLARDVRAGVKRTGEALEKAGAHVENKKPKIDGAELMDCFTAIITPIMSIGLPKGLLAAFEGMREQDRKLVATGGIEAVGAAYRLRAMASFHDVAHAMAKRQMLKDRLAEFFGESWDMIVMPISMVPSFKHLQEPGFNERVLDVDGQTVPYMNLLNWISPATALHAPALAVQAGQTSQGLPVGVQLVGPWNGEDRLFDFAAAVEEGLGGFRPPPGL